MNQHSSIEAPATRADAASLHTPVQTGTRNPWLKPRTFTVEHDPDVGYASYYGTAPLNWCLRMYGHGGGTVANGVPNRFADEATAHRVGKHWVETGERLELDQ